MIIFSLPGIPPSKKNCKKVYCRGRKPIVLPSDSYKKRHQEMRPLLPQIETPITSQSAMLFHFYVPYNKDGSKSKRTFDLSNKVESLQDLFVDQGILEDDNYNILCTIIPTRSYVPYLEGRVDIKIIHGDDYHEFNHQLDYFITYFLNQSLNISE